MLKTFKPSVLSLVAACTMASVPAGSASASVLASSQPNPFTFSVAENLTSGSGSAEFKIGAVPAGKYYVVQTVSYSRSGALTGTSGKLFVRTNLAGKVTEFSIGTATEDGTGLPSATLSATFYAGPGTVLIGTFYRNGDIANQETVLIVVSGYSVIGNPTD